MDSILDVTETSRVLSALKVEQVKCHSLYILKDTMLGNMYENGKLVPVSLDEYILRAESFLENLDPDIVVQRLMGRAPKERTLFCNWNMSWWRIQDEIEQRMISEGKYQGRLCDYLNGKALR